MVQHSSPRAVPAFEPVPLRYRRDGFTPERQAAFIRALAESGSLPEACRQVGLSLESAYRLYRRPGAESFRQAWDAVFAARWSERRAALMRSSVEPARRAPWQPSTSSTFSTSAPPSRMRIVVSGGVGFNRV